MPNQPIFVPSTANRVWARGIDSVIVWIFLVPAFGWGGLFSGSGEVITIPWSLLLYLILVPLAYEALAIWIFGQTFGKWVFSLHVVSAKDDRKPVDGWQSLNRAVAGRFSLIFSHAVHAFMFFRTDRTHAVDWVAGTRVVTSRARPDRSKPRALLGLTAILLFGVLGWSTASSFVQNSGWGRGGLTISWAESDAFNGF